MAVYVDNLVDYSALAKTNGKGWKYGPSCHMVADTVEELIRFALWIGLRREWFQASPPASCNHFDLTARRRAAAIQFGAIPLDRRAFVAKVQEIRERERNAKQSPSKAGA